MKAKYLILILSLTLAAGAAAAAVKYARMEPAAAPAGETNAPAIARVVVTASRTQAAAAPIARIVVVGRRAGAERSIALNG